jgi:hypothetical protein
MATSWASKTPGSVQVASWGVTCVQPPPAWMIEPESVTVVCAPLSRRSTLLASPPRSSEAQGAAGVHGERRRRCAGGPPECADDGQDCDGTDRAHWTSPSPHPLLGFHRTPRPGAATYPFGLDIVAPAMHHLEALLDAGR